MEGATSRPVGRRLLLTLQGHLGRALRGGDLSRGMSDRRARGQTVRWHKLRVPRTGGQDVLGACEEPQGGQPGSRKGDPGSGERGLWTPRWWLLFAPYLGDVGSVVATCPVPWGTWDWGLSLGGQWDSDCGGQWDRDCVLTPHSPAGLPGQILPGPGVQLPGMPLRPWPELRHAGEPAAAGRPQPALPRLWQWPMILEHFSPAVFKKTCHRGLRPLFCS